MNLSKILSLAFATSLLLTPFYTIPGYAQTAPDTFSGTCGNTITMDVLANDTGFDRLSGNIRISLFEDAGSLSLTEDRIQFTPHTDFSGTINFDYEATDGTSTSTNSASVTVTCAAPTPVTIARPDYSALCNTSQFFSILRNDTFQDVTTLALVSQNPTVPGTVSVFTTGGLAGLLQINNYTGDFTTEYEIQYEIDGQTNSLFVNNALHNCSSALNNASVDDTFSVDAGSSTELRFFDNDMGGSIDVGQFNRYISIPEEGEIIVDSSKDSFITYVAPENFTGTDSFTHLIDDEFEIFIQQTVTVNISEPIIPVDPTDPIVDGGEEPDETEEGTGPVLVRTGGIFH